MTADLRSLGRCSGPTGPTRLNQTPPAVMTAAVVTAAAEPAMAGAMR